MTCPLNINCTCYNIARKYSLWSIQLNCAWEFLLKVKMHILFMWIAYACALQKIHWSERSVWVCNGNCSSTCFHSNSGFILCHFMLQTSEGISSSILSDSTMMIKRVLGLRITYRYGYPYTIKFYVPIKWNFKLEVCTANVNESLRISKYHYTIIYRFV